MDHVTFISTTVFILSYIVQLMRSTDSMVLCTVNAGRCIWGNMGCVRRRCNLKNSWFWKKHIVAWAVSEYILSSHTTPGLFMPSWQPQSSCWQVSAFSPSTAQRSTWKNCSLFLLLHIFTAANPTAFQRPRQWPQQMDCTMHGIQTLPKILRGS